MEWLETKYYAQHLAPAWEKILDEHKNKLDMELKNNQKLTGWEQFISWYDGYIIAYKNIDIACNKFIYIFMSNLFILEQIGKYKEQILELSKMDNWRDITTNISVGSAEGESKASSANTSKSSSKGDNINKLGIKRSDSNSFAPEGDVVPYNQFENQDNLVANTSTDESQNLDYSLSNSQNNSKSASKTETTNNARDALMYLQMEIRNLYDKFWKEFSTLFLFNC